MNEAGYEGGVNEGGRIGVEQVAHKVKVTQTDGATAKPRVT